MFSIRPYCPADSADLARLLSVLGYPTAEAEVRARLEKMAADHQQTLVAESGDKLSGFIGLLLVSTYEYSAAIGYILALSVDPDCQGQGIGKALVSAAEEWFRAQGVHDIRVNSGLHREGAHRFYETMGFEQTGVRFRKVLEP